MGTIHHRVKYDQWGCELPPQIDYHGIKPHDGTYKPTKNYYVVDNKVVMKKQIIVHTFQMGDVEDPDLYAAEPLYAWQKSLPGEWVMENCCDDAPI